MKISSLLFVLLEIFHFVEIRAVQPGDSGCPDKWGFNPENRQCYFVSKEVASFDVARGKCKDMSSSLISILTFDELIYILPVIFVHRSTCTSSDCLNYWIGLRNLNTANKGVHNCTWIDGSPMSSQWNFWGTGCPLDNHYCGVLSVLSSELYGSLNEQTCHASLRYICKREAVKSCPVGFTFMPASNSCYIILPEPTNWAKALEVCQSISRNTHLAIIRNAADSLTVTTYLQQELKGNKACYALHARGVWIAAQRKDATRCDVPYVWKTSEGRDIGFNFTNWGDGQPDCFYGEYCVHVRPAFSYKWNDLPCGEPSCVLCQLIL